jgi:hypothetical protein
MDFVLLEKSGHDVQVQSFKNTVYLSSRCPSYEVAWPGRLFWFGLEVQVLCLDFMLSMAAAHNFANFALLP